MKIAKKSPRQAARELALLGISQLPKNKEKLDKKKLQELLLAAVRTLTMEADECLEKAAEELQKASDRLLSSQIGVTDIKSARSMVYEGIELSQTAINEIGTAIELPELIQLTNQPEVRSYALEILIAVNSNTAEIDKLLEKSIVNWQIKRLPRLDLDILRIAVGEILYLGLPEQIAIEEAVKLAKRYSGEDGYKFINGVLARVGEKMKADTALASEV
ncbi:MAG: transcription antitermination factor NusB [Cyanobacteriota bacterium]|nr:transcription antitermination factor NusB [Cyanobacteriota bacterium]